MAHLSKCDELIDAVVKGEARNVRTLLDQEPQLVNCTDTRGLSAVIVAAYFHRWAIVDILLQFEPDLDVVAAAAIGSIDRLRSLLDDDPARANDWAPDGITALHLAAYYGQEEAARLLLSSGANVGAVAPAYNGIQPLHSAIGGQSAGVVQLLLDAGAEVDPVQLGGWTPLLEASAAGDIAIVEILLAAGADRSLTNDKGKSAVQLASERGHHAVAWLLRTTAE